MASVDDGFLTLVCANSIEVDSEKSEILISIENIRNWDLNCILSFPNVKIRADRNRLFEQSTYFRGLLSGSFSESLHDSIFINWNLSIFVDVLKCMHSCPLDVTSSNYLPLFEAALFFGVEMLLLKCKTWLIDVCSSSVDLGLAKLDIQDLIQIWNFGLEHANDYVPELCANYLAINFMSALSNEFFQNIPYKLLMYSIKHPFLTVDSEMSLLDALVAWINHDTTDFECSNAVDYKVLLSENRFALAYCQYGLLQFTDALSCIGFFSGKIKSSLFSSLAAESIGSILRLLKILSLDSLHEFGDSGLIHFRFRITKYSRIVNLSGCPQITSTLILLSLLPSSYSVKLSLRQSHKQLLSFLQTIETDETQISRQLSPILSFKDVVEVDISKCSKIHLETALEIFSKFFPSLQILKAAYLLNFKTAMIYQLLQKCPSVCQVDLTIDSSPLLFENLSVVSTKEVSSKISSLSYGADNIMGLKFSSLSGSEALVSNITKLSLEGRTDVADEFLLSISKCCASLQYLNLNGCTTVTDVGFSRFIRGCKGLKSIIVCDTSLGINSATALCFGTTSHDNSSTEFVTQQLHSPAFNLQELHLGGCKGVDKASLLMLMTQTQSLKSLCLRDTLLDDHVLSSSASSSLETLDVSNTMVSVAGLKCIIRKNPGLKILKARGCKNLISFPSVSEELLCNELGKICKLEELRIGWGLSYFSLEVLKPAITSLKRLTVGMGGSLGEDGLSLLPTSCPGLESMILYFQIISDHVVIQILTSLKNLKVLALCYCLGDISVSSFMFPMPNLRILRLLRVTPWMTNDHLVILTRNCGNLVELSLSGCSLLNSDSQLIISEGWPGLVSIHLEECGQVSANGISSLFNCVALEDILLRHNGHGIPKNFIFGAASKLPLLRKLSLDLCDAIEGDFDIPDHANRCFLSSVTIARCNGRKCNSNPSSFMGPHDRRPAHKETLALVWNSENLTRTIVKERLQESLD